MFQCSICLDDKNNDDKVTNHCCHSFCKDCIIRWINIKNSCPLCRSDLDKDILTIYKKGSLITDIGINSIHNYSIQHQLGYQNMMNITKGDTPDLRDEEKDLILKMTGFNIESKITNILDSNKLCIINGNILTIGKIKIIDNNHYSFQDGIAITRQEGTTFPLHPKNRIYQNSHAKKIYSLV